MLNIKQSFLMVILLSLASFASAEFYAGVNIGSAKIKDAVIDDTDTGYKLKFGIVTSDRVAFEFYYANTGKAEIDVLGTTYSEEIQGVGADVVTKIKATDNVDFTLLLGIFYWKETFSVGSVETDDDGFAPKFGVGFYYNISPKIAVGAEYEGYFVHDNRDGVDAEVLTAAFKYTF